jgi:tRNA G18 (ribose-2'-O)-methylase SpoU
MTDATQMARGFFGVGILGAKTETNVGTLWRSAQAFGAAFVFTVGRRYRYQASDTTKAHRHIPLWHFDSFASFNASRPFDCPLVGVELTDIAQPLSGFAHPERAVYLLGAEDYGLPGDVLAKCQHVIVIPGAAYCLNVASAGSIVLYDRARRAKYSAPASIGRAS